MENTVSVDRVAAMSASSPGVGPVRFVDTETHMPPMEDPDGAEDVVEAPSAAAVPSNTDPAPVNELTSRQREVSAGLRETYDELVRSGFLKEGEDGVPLDMAGMDELAKEYDFREHFFKDSDFTDEELRRYGDAVLPQDGGPGVEDVDVEDPAAQAAEKAKCPPGGTTSAPKRLRSKAAPSMTAASPVCFSTATSGSLAALSPNLKDDEALHVQSRVSAMQDKYGKQLRFLVTEFTSLEAQLAPQVEACSGLAADGAQQQLSRLRYFIAHVQNTTDRMEQARVGLHRYTASQLNMLEEHITERLLPVRERLIAQIKNQQQKSDGGSVVADERVTVRSSGGWGDGKTCVAGVDDAGVGTSDEAAVSDGWMEASKTAGALLGLSDTVQNTVETLAKPCSSLSLCELDLCGDGDGDDCGGAFLVGSDCDEDGPCIGLDLYDLGDQAKSALLLLPGERGSERSHSVCTLSVASAATDGELSDDSRSLDANRSGEDDKPEVRNTMIDREMGELSDLFAPDEFILSSILEQEDSTTRVADMDGTLDVSGTLETSAVPTPAPVATSETPHAQGSANPACRPPAANSGVPKETAPAPVLDLKPLNTAMAPAHVRTNVPVTPSSALGHLHVASCAHGAHPSGGAWPIMGSTAGQNGHNCRCGRAPCLPLTPTAEHPVQAMATRKRQQQEGVATPTPTPTPTLGEGGSAGIGGSSSGSAQAPLETGMTLSHMGLPRSRKRQRSLAPVLSAPRTVSYECSMCKENYQAEVSSNPWWSLFRQECPKCHRVQIPRVDAASAANSIDYIHAVCAEEGEGWESDGYGSDSCSESDDEGEDYAGEGMAIMGVEDGDNKGGTSAEGSDGRLTTAQASRLLVLMAHARTCPGHHAKPQHAEVCRSIKFLMLHIRDCTGRGPQGGPCAHRWCRPCKSLLGHLVRCPQPESCRICTPLDLPTPLRQLRELNMAQARTMGTASAPDPRFFAPVKTEGHFVDLQTQSVNQR